MTIPHSYRSYKYHIRVDRQEFSTVVAYVTDHYPNLGYDDWRTFAGKIIAVNDEYLAVDLALRFSE